LRVNPAKLQTTRTGTTASRGALAVAEDTRPKRGNSKVSKRPKNKSSRQHETHDHSPFSIICQHLCLGTRLRYFTVKPLPSRPGVSHAWCEACHAVLQEEDGWSDRAMRFADLSPVCKTCYEEILERHTRLELVD
jgi:hypothetical protein